MASGFIGSRFVGYPPSLSNLVVHTKGKGIAGTYTFEVAEQKQCEVLLMAKIEEHPLRVEVERA
jgi:ATP-dependent Clp protease adapter protein ClpS